MKSIIDKPTNKMDNLKRSHLKSYTIKTLVAHIRAMRAQKVKDDTLHQEERKELLHAITVSKRRIKKLEQQVENYRNNKQLIHLQEIVKSHALKDLELNKKINAYELEKLNV